MKQEEWIRRLERHMADHQESPSHDLWEGIEASLNGRKEPERKARFVSLRRWAVAAALAAVMIGGGYFYWNTEPTTDTPQTATESEKLARTDSKAEKDTPEQGIAEKLIAAVEEKIQTEQAEIRQAEMRQTDNRQAMTEPAEQSEAAETAPTDETVETQEVTPANETEDNKQRQQPGQIRQPGHVSQKNPYSDVSTTRRRYRIATDQLALGVYTGGNLSGWDQVNGVQVSRMTRASESDETPTSNYLEGYEVEQKHRRPIILGLTVSYAFSEKFSLSTGVVYTGLHSDFNTTMTSGRIHTGQDLYYIGIPLSLQYQVWGYKGLRTYISAGGQADWNVKVYVRQDRVNQDIQKDDMQWSVAGSLGVQYNFIPQIGIYVEPGIRHYFDNGSNVRNFFKDKPTDFSLQLGLRVNL